jgi:translocation and assembly module TamA
MSDDSARYAPRALLVLLLCFAPVLHADVDIELAGVDGPLAAAVTASLSLNRVAQDDQLGAARVRYLHARAPGEIRQALRAFSHFSPDIDAELEQRGADWVARYRIDPGPRARISQSLLRVQGEAEVNGGFDDWLSEPALQPGAALDQQAYEQIKTEMLERAAAAGYYDARFIRSRIEVDPASNSATLALIFDSGPLYRVRAFAYSAAPVRESLLQRFQTFQPGDPVSTDQLLRMQRGLIDSDYFSRVELQPRWDLADAQHQIPIDVTLEANERTAYRFGLGYGTDTGARLSARQNRRWVNDRGHRMDNILRLSEVSNTLSTRYEIPGADPLTDRYVVRGLYEEENTDTADTTKWVLGVQEQKYRGPHRLTYGVALEQETFSFGADEETTRLLVPELGWQLIEADNRLDPTHGYRLGVDLSAAAQSVLSDISFVQARADAKAVLSLGTRWRLLTRAEAGATAVSDFARMPASRRFFAGGDTSVRGYDYKTLGPRDNDGDVRGGRYLLAGSVEFDYRVTEHWRGALFWDAGNAFDSLNEPLLNSVGVGVRWQSPVGPVRLDLAKPLDDDGIRLHFTLGPDL